MSASGTAGRTYRLKRLDSSASAQLFGQLGTIHIDSIRDGILGALGSRFVAALYRCLSESNDVLIFVALLEDKVIGFVLGSANVMRSLKSIGLIGFSYLALRACANGWRPKVFLKILQSCAYFFRKADDAVAGLKAKKASHPNRAELLAIAVDKNSRGLGVGKSLVTALEAEFQKRVRGGEYFVSTNLKEIGSNAFYRASGFTLVGHKSHHEMMLNIYKKELLPC